MTVRRVSASLPSCFTLERVEVVMAGERWEKARVFMPDLVLALKEFYDFGSELEDLCTSTRSLEGYLNLIEDAFFRFDALQIPGVRLVYHDEYVILHYNTGIVNAWVDIWDHISECLKEG